MKQSISFITLAVNDFNTELKFYTDTLGWEPFTVITDTIAFFNTGSFVFSICRYEELANDIGQPLETRPYIGVTLAQNVASEAKVDEIFSRLCSAGVTIVKEPVRANWGGYSGYFSDPEGHLWEVAYNPQFEYDKDGIMIMPNK